MAGFSDISLDVTAAQYAWTTALAGFSYFFPLPPPQDSARLQTSACPTPAPKTTTDTLAPGNSTAGTCFIFSKAATHYSLAKRLASKDVEVLLAGSFVSVLYG